MGASYNLLVEPLFAAAPVGRLSLPGVLAALSRDEIEQFPALRPHQVMFWHMFLVQLAALALHRAGRVEPFHTEEEWTAALRGLTGDFPDDEPWHLVVDDWTKPAFMQPPVSDDARLGNEVATSDALDLPITSKNHDLKQAIARAGTAEDWVFAAISLQTGEGFGGSGNQGIARMNGGFSSRAMLALAPLPEGGKVMAPRPGAWFCRDLRVLLETREDVLEKTGLRYADQGLGLTWLAPWPEETQLQIEELDLWFIEVCRRVRLLERDGRLLAMKGTSKATRINAKQYNGNLEDPWAPVHTTQGKSFTLGDEGDFDYRTLTNLLFSSDWTLPLLAMRASFETPNTPLAVLAQAIARGNSKTGGFRSRIVPIRSRGAAIEWGGGAEASLRRIAEAQIKEIGIFDKALANALALAAANGERDKISRETYDHTRAARTHLDRFADTIFFDHLWARFDVEGEAEEERRREEMAFVHRLWERTQAIFDDFLPAMPCHSLYRHRAEAMARPALRSSEMRKKFPELFASGRKGKVENAA